MQNPTLDDSYIRARLNGPVSSNNASSIRGDDDLNPGMPQLRDPLTPAAVLVPLVPRAIGFHVLLTKRTDHLHDHAGQISFPGGRVDAEDKNAIATALRETYEETGIHIRHIEIIGEMDQYITRTGFTVTPIIGLITPPFTTKPDPFEVADIFEVPLDFFMNRNNHQRHEKNILGTSRYFYAMPYKDHYIWGATAGMLVNLVDILEGDLTS
jgi:8-oxo-dGTP pyrophosphatase MutT (NUDIX family)